ncbi:MAG: glycine cleavage system protein R [Acidimicrobiales bacterium]
MHVAVSAIGVDRPGIVAAVTGVLMDHGCNLEDTSMSILRGHFAMMLVVAVPPEEGAADLEAALAPAAEDLGLVVTVRSIDDEAPASPPGQPWQLAVYGTDRPGIVHRIARLLAEQQVNIVDLTTRMVGVAEPVYVMLLDVTIPGTVDPEALRAGLERLGRELAVECSLHPADVDVL